jgi:subtilisin-like proprotein convertase family protein
MVSRQFTPDQGIAEADRLALDGLAQQTDAAGRDRIHALVQLDFIPTEAEKNALARQGLVLLEYIPNYAWIAAVPVSNPAGVLSIPGVRWLGSLAAADKVDAALPLDAAALSSESADNRVVLYVVMHRDVSPEVGQSLLAGYGEVKSYTDSSNLYVVWMDPANVEALLADDRVSWVQPAEPGWTPINNVARQWIDSDVLDSASYGSADGTNVDILIYDGGGVRSTHQELTGRVTLRDTAGCPAHDHPTHVACTTSASGVTAAATGHANNMHALLSDCMSSSTGIFFYTDPGELQSDLVYAKDTWSPSGGDADGAELLNASVGTNTAPNGFPCVYEGNYGPTDIILDNVVRGDVAASGKFIAIWANGNERGSGRCGSSYHTTAPPACGKNAIQVGATNKDADTMTSFSSWGPCDDGRIKPVISAPGCASSGSIYSCSAASDTGYTNMCGTSMASPATAGVVAQLIEYCRAQGLAYCPADGEFWPSSARALLMHAAIDLGNAGPDYQYGYGRIEADASADLLTNSAPNYADLRQDQISAQSEIDTYQITISGSPAQLKVSLSWDDEAATMQALRKLVNNLDLEVVAPGGTVYYPYVLDPVNPGNTATTGVDNINNQEQVVVASPANGAWTIRVIGRAVPAAPQDYSIVFPNAYNTAPNQTPGATPTTTPTPDPAYCAEYITNGSIESGTTGWTISGSAAQSNTYAHAGAYSMRSGGASDGGFYQDITAPSDMYYGTIGFWYRMQTSETSHPYDFFDVEVRDPATNQALTTLLSTDDSRTNGVWTQALFTIGPEYAGRSVRLHFSADVDTAVNTYWYTDEVSMYLCRTSSGGSTPTRTPTLTNPPPTFTPTRTSTNPPVTFTPTRTNTAQPPTATPTRTSTNLPVTFTPTRTNTAQPPTFTPTVTATPPSQYCSSGSFAIVDNGSTSNAITVSDARSIQDLNVSLNVAHTYVGDLIFTLVHNGATVALIDRPGVPGSTYGCSGDNIVATLDDEASQPVESQCASGTPTINGAFRPNALLSGFDGLAIDGTWTLNVTDAASGDTGTVNQWCLIPVLGGALPTSTPTSTAQPPTRTPTPTATTTCPNASGGYCRTDTETRTWIAGTTNQSITSDDTTKNVALPFTFTFAGTGYTSVNISSNGNIHFATASNAYNNVAIPNTANPNAMIAAYWDDLDPGIGGAIYTGVSGAAPNRIFVIEWRDVRRHSGGANGVTFEIQLVEGSNHAWILVSDGVFGSSTYDYGLSATCGVENTGGTAGNQYSHNTAVLTNNRVIHFWPQ